MFAAKKGLCNTIELTVAIYKFFKYRSQNYSDEIVNLLKFSLPSICKLAGQA